jgi:hypothetical protein
MIAIVLGMDLSVANVIKQYRSNLQLFDGNYQGNIAL